MEVEKGVIAAVVNENGRVLVLKRKKNWEGWELLKGGLEKDDRQETVLTELEEEAGIAPEHVQTIIDLEHTTEWKFEKNDKKVKKEYKAYAVEVKADTVDTSNNPSDEHEHGFFLRPRHVKEMLEYQDQVEVLEKACKELDISLK